MTLRGLQTDGKPSCKYRYLPTTENRGPLCIPFGRQGFLQVGYDPGIPTNTCGRGIQKVHNPQYPQGTIPIYATAIWCSIGAIHLPEGILQGIPGVCVYLDDILVSGKDIQEHNRNLEAVFTRLEEAGFRPKRTKCYFMLSAIEYLGYKISAEGLHPTTEKIRAIQQASPPQDITQLRSFIGIVNYYYPIYPLFLVRCTSYSKRTSPGHGERNNRQHLRKSNPSLPQIAFLHTTTQQRS